MDFNVDPCEDFFNYACSNWNKEHIIPDDRTSISTFEVMADKLQVHLRRTNITHINRIITVTGILISLSLCAGLLEETQSGKLQNNSTLEKTSQNVTGNAMKKAKVGSSESAAGVDHCELSKFKDAPIQSFVIRSNNIRQS